VDRIDGVELQRLSVQQSTVQLALLSTDPCSGQVESLYLYREDRNEGCEKRRVE
jgi:hypothetical protein